MRNGAAPLLIAGDGRWRGPGAQWRGSRGGGDKLVYLATTRSARGVATLRISPLVWDARGGPQSLGDSLWRVDELEANGLARALLTS